MKEYEDAPEENEEDELYEHYRFNADKGQQPLRVDKFLMNYIKNNDFSSFGWYRIIVGLLIIAYFRFF